MSIEALRQLLIVREALDQTKELIENLYGPENLEEITKMQKLERQLFDKVSEWDKP